MNVVIGQIFALLTALCWAQNSLVYSYLGKKVGSDAVTHIRLWLALPIMFLVNYLFTGSLFPCDISSGTFLLIFVSGLFGFFVADLFLFRAFVEIGAREALVVMTTGPIFSLVFSRIFLKEYLSLLNLLGILIVLAGVIFVIIDDNRGDRELHRHKKRGAVYALSGAITQAIGLIFAKMAMMDGIHPVSTNLIRIIAGFTGLFIYSLFRKKVVEDFKTFNNGKYLLLLLFAVLAGPVLGIILSLYALNWAPVGIVTTLMQVSPVMLLPVDIFILKKRVSPVAVLGTCIAVAGTVLLFIS
jgi:drug/metabolite transporter (DMT)-like permease